MSILKHTFRQRKRNARVVSYNIGGHTVYRTAEAAERLRVSRQTLLRWLHEGRVDDVHRDHRGWRIFSDEDIRRIKQQIESGDG